MSEAQSLLARSHANEASLRMLLEQAADWYWETDTGLHLTSVRAAAGAARGIGPQDWIGRRFWEVPAVLLAPLNWEEQRQCLEARRPFANLVLRMAGVASGEGRIAHFLGAPVFGAQGVFQGYVGIGRDVTEEQDARMALQRLASMDSLTQLLNRQAFDAGAQQVLADSYAHGRQCALLCIGVDRFELFNSVYGHNLGDAMLAAVAAQLRARIRPPNLLGRRGGNEIVAVLVDAQGPEQARVLAREVAQAVAQVERLGNVAVSVRASVGIGVFPTDGGDLDALLDAAEAALACARESGGASVASFTPELGRRIDLRQRLEQRLRKAYESRDFRLVYQPLVSLPEGLLVGAEALLRWKDAELGDVDPGEFIPIAEQSGLIEAVGDWVLREACRQRQLWRQVGLDLPPVAINVSGVQLRNRTVVDSILATLDEFEVLADELEIEVTETGLMDLGLEARASLERLRSAGIKTALDDFGVGYSSLAHLRDLPMHRLKIDRSFTVECMRDARTLTIVKAVIEMAHNLGLTVTAEGIETVQQQAWMHHLGCDSAQGYYFSRPLPAEEFLTRFLEGRGRAAAAAAPPFHG